MKKIFKYFCLEYSFYKTQSNVARSLFHLHSTFLRTWRASKMSLFYGSFLLFSYFISSVLTISSVWGFKTTLHISSVRICNFEVWVHHFNFRYQCSWHLGDIVSNSRCVVLTIWLILNIFIYGQPVLTYFVSITWLYQLSAFLISGFFCIFYIKNSITRLIIRLLKFIFLNNEIN